MGEDVLGLADAVEASDVAAAGVHDVGAILIFLGQTDEPLLVSDDVGVGDERRHLFEAALQSVELL